MAADRMSAPTPPTSAGVATPSSPVAPAASHTWTQPLTAPWASNVWVYHDGNHNGRYLRPGNHEQTDSSASKEKMQHEMCVMSCTASVQRVWRYMISPHIIKVVVTLSLWQRKLSTQLTSRVTMPAFSNLKHISETRLKKQLWQLQHRRTPLGISIEVHVSK